MIIIFGTRPYFRRKKVAQFGFCANCNRYSKMRSFTAMRFFHLYYVPLIPTEGTRRTHKLCSKCNVGVLYEPDTFDNIISVFKTHAAEALVSIQEGEATFLLDEPDAEPLDCVQYLHVVLDWLYASKNIDFCLSILNQLTAPNCRFAFSMLTASLETMRGKLDKAIDAYNDAISVQSTSCEAHQWKGHLLVERRRPDEAIEAYKVAIGLVYKEAPEKLFALYWQMAEQQMATKRFADAAASYDRVLELRPEFASDPNLIKLHKKAKKKAGIA